MLKLLLDENISPRISAELWSIPVDNVHLRDRGMLGEPDHVVWRFAVEEQRTMVTINECDFRDCLRKENQLHAGLIVIPTGGTFQMQLGYIQTAINHATAHDWPDFNIESRYCKIELDNGISFPPLF